MIQGTKCKTEGKINWRAKIECSINTASHTVLLSQMGPISFVFTHHCSGLTELDCSLLPYTGSSRSSNCVSPIRGRGAEKTAVG